MPPHSAATRVASRRQAGAPSPGEPGERLFFLDWLRVAAFVALVCYHVGMYYVTWDFHVKSPYASRALEPWMRLTEPWRMSLLFMVSGAATALMLKGGASVALMRSRSRYLFLPLVCGMVLVVPPQAYFQVVQKFSYAGDYLDFLGLYFRGYKGFCQAGRCVALPTWNHLWFLPYLWVYTLLLWGAVRLWPGTLPALGRAATRWLNGPLLMLLPIAWLLLGRLTLADRFPQTYALRGDWFRHALYFSVFLTGAACAAAPVMWERLARWRWPALWAALLLWAVLVGVRPGRPWEHAVIASLQWCALTAAFGFARQGLNRDHPWRQELTEAVFPIYLLHQTLIITLSQWLLPLDWKPALEGPVLVLATLALSYAGYRLVRPWPWVRPWFGLRPLPQPMPQPQTPAR